MDSFARFIPDGIDLDPAAVRSAGLAARPFPEWASPDDVAALGRQVGAERAELWSWEHRRRPHHFAGLSLVEAGRQSFDLGHASVLVAFETPRTYIWLPLEHEFFVIVAPPAALEAIRAAAIFTYGYDEYAHEPYFAGKRSAFLIAAGRRYTIDPSGGDADVPIARP